MTFAQYTEEWSVAQPYAESGIIHYDFDRDGSRDLTKFFLNTMTVYSGADAFNVIWSVILPERDQLLLWNEYPIGVNRAYVSVFFANTLVDSSMTELIAYPSLGANPRWRTGLLPGYQSFLDTANVDDDAVTEIVYGLNQWDADAEQYFSRFYVLNSSTGATEFTSERYSGYLVGPYLGNLDGDGAVEILLNIYNIGDTTSTLKAISFDANQVASEELRPVSTSLLGAAYPNPFNSSTAIPLALAKASDVKARIVDLQGRSITLILEGRLAAGQHSFTWNGLDPTGRPLPSGSYFVEFQVGANRFTKPLTLLR